MNRGRVRFRSWRITAPHKALGGYTIVETLIFLAVSGAMFMSVMLLVNGQQGRAEFTQAVRTFETSLQDVANDVSTGYSAYPFNPGESCKVTGTGSVLIDSTAVGSQQRCIFVGRVFHAVPAGTDAQTYHTYTVVGRQRVSAGGREVTNLTEAQPVALTPGTGNLASVPNRSQTQKVSSVASIASVVYRQGATATPISSFGFFTTFNGYNAGGNLNSGALQVDVAPISGSGTVQNPQGSTVIADQIARHRTTPTITPVNPNGGITICLVSNSSRQYALVNLGGSSTGRLTVTSSIQTGNASNCP